MFHSRVHGWTDLLPFYVTLCFLMIFHSHSHIIEKNNMTATWLLVTVSIVVLHAGLIFLCKLTGGWVLGSGEKKYIYDTIWLLRFIPLISRKYKHFTDCIELYWVTQSACTRNVLLFSYCKAGGWESQTTDQTFYLSDSWIWSIWYIHIHN